ncbi:MAG: hypothetical protein AB7K52_02520 [Phycisphaerales bacterium]
MIADPHKLGNPDAFDELADLFLGQMGTVHAHDAALGAIPMARSSDRTDPPASRGPITPAERAPSAPRLTLVSDRAEAPAPRTWGPPVDRCPIEHTPRIEVLLLGHLPVMAAAWVGQYVRHVADRVQAPVALARLSAGSLRVELHAPAGCRPEVVSGNTLESALRTMHASARRVVIVTPSAREMEAVASAGVSRVSLLTSGDEAGIVAAYGIVKSVAQRLRDGRGIDPASVLRVAVMGAPPGRAEFVINRLRDASRAFLGLDLQADTCIPRIGMTPGQSGLPLFDGPFDAPIDDLVAMVGLGPVARADVSAPPSGAGKPGVSTRASDEHVLHIADAPVPDDLPSEPEGDSRAHTSEDPVMPAADEESARDADVVLSAFIPGLERLVARCPYAEEIELAAEEPAPGAAARRLHLLVRAERYADRARAMERLAIASDWARAHRRLLELTTGEAAWTLSADAPQQHVFTDQPAAWRRLLDSHLRIHVLTPRTPVQHPDWACAPVN